MTTEIDKKLIDFPHFAPKFDLMLTLRNNKDFCPRFHIKLPPNGNAFFKLALPRLFFCLIFRTIPSLKT